MQETSFRIIPKPRMKTPFGVNLLVGVAISLFVLAGILYGALCYQESVLKTKDKILDADIIALETSDAKEIEAELSILAQRTKDFSKIYQTRAITANLFFFLKDSCHPKVQLTDLSFNQADFAISLKGITENFKTLAEAIMKWQIDGRVASATDEINLSDISLTKEGQVSFGLQFALKPFLFTR